MKNFYRTLNIASTASQTEIRQAYRRLARMHHPDISRSPMAEERFKSLGEAYETLGNPEKRAQYDVDFRQRWGSYHNHFNPKQKPRGAQRQRHPRDQYASSEFSDFFHNMFRNGKSTTGSSEKKSYQRAGQPASGLDLEAKLPLTLEDAAAGGMQEVSLEIPDLKESRTFYVDIQRGVRHGHRMVLKGQGQAGKNGGAAGDLHMTIELLPHRTYRLEGWDLHARLPITPWEAALGCKIKLPTMDGRIKVQIPPGSPSGRKIRIRGKGFPSGSKGCCYGDMFLELSIVVPKEMSLTEKRLFKKLAAKSSFDPRG